MLVLFDHSTPAPLRYALKAHTVVEAVERGWETLANGALLQEAEAAGFEVFITADKNIRYQQNLTRRRIAILVLENAQWPILRPHVGRVVAAVNAAGDVIAEDGSLLVGPVGERVRRVAWADFRGIALLHACHGCSFRVSAGVASGIPRIRGTNLAAGCSAPWLTPRRR